MLQLIKQQRTNALHSCSRKHGGPAAGAGGGSGRAEPGLCRAARGRCLGLVLGSEGEQLEVELSCQCSSENRVAGQN